MEIAKKELQKLLAQQNKEMSEEFQRHLGFAVETFEDQLKGIAEVVSGINE